jgi:hypothetical protein
MPERRDAAAPGRCCQHNPARRLNPQSLMQKHGAQTRRHHIRSQANWQRIPIFRTHAILSLFHFFVLFMFLYVPAAFLPLFLYFQLKLT